MKNKINVVAAAIIKDHHLLVARRAPHLRHGGLWELPGGKVEDAETDEIALTREISEELNLSIEVYDHVAESLVEVNGRWIQMRVYQSVVHDFSKLRLADHSAIKWITAGELFDLEWAPADVPLLDELSLLLSG